MTKLEYLQETKANCLRHLSAPEWTCQNGRSSYDVFGELLEKTEDELIEFTGIKMGKKGQFVHCYIDPEKADA